MSNFIIYNPQRERIGILQNIESIQWLDHYQATGEVKIVARPTPENCELLAVKNRIYNTEEKTSAKIVEALISVNEEEDSLTVRAFLTSRLLDDRVVMATEKVTNVEAAMYGIYQRNRRGLPIECAPLAGYPEKTETEVTWNSVLAAELKLAEAGGLGFTVLFEPQSGTETFLVYKGVDRFDPSNPNYVGFFSTDTGDIENLEILRGEAKYRNVAIVAGEGDGAARQVQVISSGVFEGEERHEQYIDARDLQKKSSVAVDTGKTDENGNPIYTYQDKVYSDDEYKMLLQIRGLEKLAETPIDFDVKCDIEQTNLVYGVDYFLGDRMPVKILEYDIFAIATVSSINRIYEDSGEKVVATLSNFKV